MIKLDDIVLNAMRLAEKAHREHNHFRKAPDGEDKPAYFIHLAEVAWMLQDAGMANRVVSAGYLHDMIEDCAYTRQRLADELGDDKVAELVEWVSEPEKDQSWEIRNRGYLEKIKVAPDEAVAISCADKTSNIRDMNRFLAKGYSTQSFTKRGHDIQLKKFEALHTVFIGKTERRLLGRFERALKEFATYG